MWGGHGVGSGGGSATYVGASRQCGFDGGCGDLASTVHAVDQRINDIRYCLGFIF